MRNSTVFLLILALSPLATTQARARFLTCESTFNGESPAAFPKKSRLDERLINESELFQNLEKRVRIETLDGQRVAGIRLGRFGGSPQTFEETIELSNSRIEGLETRPSPFADEVAALDLHVRLKTHMNDIFKVPLSSEIDSLAFLLARSLRLPTTLVDNVNARGFIVQAGQAPLATGASGFREMRIGRDFKIVGVSTLHTSRHGHAQAVLQVQDINTKSVYEIRSRTSAQGVKSLEAILDGKGTLVLEGTAFSLARPTSRPDSRR